MGSTYEFFHVQYVKFNKKQVQKMEGAIYFTKQKIPLIKFIKIAKRD